MTSTLKPFLAFQKWPVQEESATVNNTAHGKGDADGYAGGHLDRSGKGADAPREARFVADQIGALGYEVTTGATQRGVGGLLRNGAGHHDQHEHHDAAPVNHMLGHDPHAPCLLAAAEVLASDKVSWSGTLILVFQLRRTVGHATRTTPRGALRFYPLVRKWRALARRSSPELLLSCEASAPLPTA